MSRIYRFSSFLDRFDKRLEVNGQQLKSQFNEWVDQHIGLIRTQVRKLKTNFGGGRDFPLGNVVEFSDDSLVETVSLNEYFEQHAAATELANEPPTSKGRKRPATQSASNQIKKRKSNQNGINQTNKFVCKFEGCGKSFDRIAKLRSHEFLHLGIKPFSCAWPNCSYSSEQRGNVVVHVRFSHFKLPRLQKEQLNIADDRDPNDYVQVNNELANRRLE